jgi:hypothetical protein
MMARRRAAACFTKRPGREEAKNLAIMCRCYRRIRNRVWFESSRAVGQGGKKSTRLRLMLLCPVMSVSGIHSTIMLKSASQKRHEREAVTGGDNQD